MHAEIFKEIISNICEEFDIIVTFRFDDGLARADLICKLGKVTAYKSFFCDKNAILWLTHTLILPPHSGVSPDPRPAFYKAYYADPELISKVRIAIETFREQCRRP